MFRPVRLFFAGCALALVAAAVPAGGGGATQVARDSQTFSPGAQVAAANWTEMPNLTTMNAPPDANAVDNAVSCVNADFCMAVGAPGNLTLPPFAEMWNGSIWAEVSLPPADGQTGLKVQLAGISCVTTQFCIAVGNVVNAGLESPLIEQWNGAAWTVVQDIGSDTTALQDVSCPTVNFCMAVGTLFVSPNSVFVEEWNGSSWTPTTLTAPAGTVDAFGSGVSCTTPTFCMIVGTAGNSTSGGAYAASWDGTTWTPSALSNSFPDVILESVSCVGVSFCMADGIGGVNGNHPIVDSWDGAGWTQETVPTLPAAGKLFGISCISASACTAVGQFLPTVGGTTSTLAFTWNGLAWSQATNTPDAAGAAQTFFTDVACLTNWACVAVGTFESSGGQFLPFNASAPIARSGYRVVAADGGVFGFGAPFFGSLGGIRLNAPIVGMATMPAGDGYDLVASDGGVFSYGSAQFYGSMGGVRLNKPIVGMAVTPDGAGYWLVASDGGIFAFGDAPFFGSMGGKPLNKPIVGMAAAPNGDGYYEVASDGGIFTFPTQGGPAFQGSTGTLRLNKPIVGMSVNAAGQYYLVASDGGIFAFPTLNGAPFYGSAGSLQLVKPIIGMSAVSGGYYLAGSDGGIFAFPTANGPPFFGSTGDQRLARPVVGISS
jgi:hypothetical protein